jgi:hypothetical protein
MAEDLRSFVGRAAERQASAVEADVDLLQAIGRLLVGRARGDLARGDLVLVAIPAAHGDAARGEWRAVEERVARSVIGSP